jgi:hypothetical protein
MGLYLASSSNFYFYQNRNLVENLNTSTASFYSNNAQNISSRGNLGWWPKLTSNGSDSTTQSNTSFYNATGGLNANLGANSSLTYWYNGQGPTYSNCPNTTGLWNITANTTISANYTCDVIIITNNATLTLNNSAAGNTTISLTANNLTIDLGSNLSAAGTGYSGGSATIGNGPGGGRIGTNYIGAGAGHGGNGESGYYSATAAGGGGAYDNITNPTQPGSGGGSFSTSYKGGNGGGAILLNITNTLNISGTISADGTNGANSTTNNAAGGGSGGSIWIITGTITGNGNISAKGGNTLYTGATTYGGGGAGGRIAIYYNTNNYTGTINNYGGTEGTKGTAGAGTTYTKSNTQTYGDLTIDNKNNILNNTETPLNDTTYNLDNTILQNGARISFATTTNYNGGNLNITNGTALIDIPTTIETTPTFNNITINENTTLTHTHQQQQQQT